MAAENTSRNAVFFSYLRRLKTPYLGSLKSAYSVLCSVERHGWAFVPDGEAAFTAEDSVYDEGECRPASAMFDEMAGLQFGQRLA